jgi:four helix bundle protein
MDNKEFAKTLETRTKKFAIEIISLSSIIPYSIESKVIRNQLTKSGTSIGANYREANRARSKADFQSRIGICESETSETLYWLEILAEMNWISPLTLDEITKETHELLAIFSTIRKSLKIK